MDTSDFDPPRVWSVPIPYGLGNALNFCVMMYPNQVRLCMLSQVGPGHKHMGPYVFRGQLRG